MTPCAENQGNIYLGSVLFKRFELGSLFLTYVAQIPI